MVFVNTKAFVERVARTLERHGYRVGVLSGDVPQKKRESLLNRFQKGQLEILVATDVAARGLHIDGVKYVYNYDLPFDAEDYVHRIGRTARLGEEGDAISFACERYAMSLPDIEAYIEQKIPVEPVTSELLTPLPRAPRVPVEGEEADDDAGDSVGTIFREARAACRRRTASRWWARWPRRVAQRQWRWSPRWRRCRWQAASASQTTGGRPSACSCGVDRTSGGCCSSGTGTFRGRGRCRARTTQASASS